MKTKNVLMKKSEVADMITVEDRRQFRAKYFVVDDFNSLRRNLRELEECSKDCEKWFEMYDPMDTEYFKSQVKVVNKLFNSMETFVEKDERSIRQERRMLLVHYLLGVKLHYVIRTIDDLLLGIADDDETAINEVKLMREAAECALLSNTSRNLEAALELTLNYQIMNYDY